MATTKKGRPLKTARESSTSLPRVLKGTKRESREGFPIQQLSASAIIRFTENPILFKIEYVNGDRFDSSEGANLILGKAFHKALEVYYGGSDELIVTNEDEGRLYGLQAGMEYAELYPDGYIRWTAQIPDKQKLKERLAFAFNEYVARKPFDQNEEILGLEEKIEEAIDFEWRGQRLELPVKLKGYLDKVSRRNGKIVITDFKTCYAFSDPEKIDGAKLVQAVVYYLLAYAKYGEEPYAVEYEEVKYTGNREKGESQLREYQLVFAEHDLFFDLFFRLYDDIIRALSGEAVFVPNLRSLFDNEVAIMAYIHRLDIDEETAKLMKKHRVQNITELLKRKIAAAGSMRKLLRTVEKQFVSAINLNYETMTNEQKIQTKLLEHGMMVQFDSKVEGASVDLYRYTPSIGLKMGKLGAYLADVEQVLGTSGVRVLAPIPDTSLIGFEVPRKKRTFPTLPKHNGTHEIAIGETVDGNALRYDLRDMPHLLVAGSSGSGKSVFLHNTIRQLMETPSVDLHLFDPKRVELSQYEGEVKEYADDPKEIVLALKRLTDMMDERYKRMKADKVKTIRDSGRMRYHYVVIDEYADLAMRAEVAHYLKLLAQKGRAAGIHIVLATQRASTKVIDGDIKVNFPVKVVFKMAKAVDSVIMLDEPGAEKLLGKGDMLFASDAGIQRLQAYSAH